MNDETFWNNFLLLFQIPVLNVEYLEKNSFGVYIPGSELIHIKSIPIIIR